MCTYALRYRRLVHMYVHAYIFIAIACFYKRRRGAAQQHTSGTGSSTMTKGPHTARDDAVQTEPINIKPSDDDAIRLLAYYCRRRRQRRKNKTESEQPRKTHARVGIK